MSIVSVNTYYMSLRDGGLSEKTNIQQLYNKY